MMRCMAIGKVSVPRPEEREFSSYSALPLFVPLDPALWDDKQGTIRSNLQFGEKEELLT